MIAATTNLPPTQISHGSPLVDIIILVCLAKKLHGIEETYINAKLTSY